VLEVEEGSVEVLSTNGDTHLGGDDFDEELINFIADDFKKKEGVDLRKDPMALQRLREAAEKAKKELSSSQNTDINLPFITADASGAKHLQMSISRAQFERLIDKLVERCRKPVEMALSDAKLKPEQIDEVVLVGGSTRVPMVVEFVKKIFNGKEPHKGVNPDEVVSIGAAIQGAVLTGDVKDVVLLDVTPLSLGIETEGGVMTNLIDRNTTIPVTKSNTFSTAADNQTAVTVRVFQGERPMANDNRLLDQFNLEGIPPAPRGMPQVEVTFDIDVNGILSVSAKDKASGKQHQVKIQQSSGLSKDEIDKMKRDAESHAADDKKKRELAEARNKAEHLVYQTEKLMKEHAEKLDAGSKSAVESASAKVQEALKGDDVAAINSAAENLEQATHALSKHMYESQQTAGGAPEGTPSDNGQAAGGDENVIDAEFEKKA
jgi:molecular chaperone DnaK